MALSTSRLPACDAEMWMYGWWCSALVYELLWLLALDHEGVCVKIFWSIHFVAEQPLDKTQESVPCPHFKWTQSSICILLVFLVINELSDIALQTIDNSKKIKAAFHGVTHSEHWLEAGSWLWMVKADFLMRAKSGISFMSAPGVFQVFFTVSWGLSTWIFWDVLPRKIRCTGVVSELF